MPLQRLGRAAVTLLAALCGPQVQASARQIGPNDFAPCQRLADLARKLPASAWKDGFGALAPSLSIVRWDAPQSAEAQAIAQSQLVKDALSASDAQVTARPLAPGVYLATAVAGTLECESVATVLTSPGQPPRLGPPPPVFSELLCWTDGGAPGRAFGQPMFVETSDFFDPAANEQHLELTPWTGAAWGPSCELSLKYRIRFTLSERFCGDAKVCRAAAPLAAAVAAAHGRARFDAPFRFGPPPSRAAEAMVAALRGPGSDDYATPVFPTFGDKAKTQFDGYSYEGLKLFPLMLDGAPYAAAIGFGGVGWRKIGDSLFAVYRAEEGQLTPLAGFVMVRSVTGLAAATVLRPKPPPPR